MSGPRGRSHVLSALVLLAVVLPFAGTGEEPVGTVTGGGHAGPAISTADTSVRWTDLDTGVGPVGTTCGVNRTGRVHGWGGNASGTLGIADIDLRAVSRPVPVAAGFEARRVAVGGGHVCALQTDGRAHCWGDNHNGQLGTGDTRDAPVPRPLADTLRFTDIGAGWRHTCGLTTDGGVLCWGDPTAGALGDGSGAMTLSGESPTPWPIDLEEDLTLTELSVGPRHGCALTAEGKAYCWGEGIGGQLGTGTTDNALTPAPVRTDRRFTRISAGSSHTCALTEGDALYCWGSNANGQLGADGLGVGRRPTDDPATLGPAYRYPTPRQVAEPGRFTQIAAGGQRTCGLTEGGRAFCWGANHRGQLGDGSQTAAQLGHGPETREPAPRPVAGDLMFEELVSGDQYSCGRTPEGRAYCWGSNPEGRLGTTGVHRPSPVAVRSPDSSFASENRPPMASVERPEGGPLYGSSPDTIVRAGDSLSLWGLAADYEDGALDGDAVVWTSSEDGRLGTGTRLEVLLDAEAVHTIRMIVTDSEGTRTRDSVLVEVEGGGRVEGPSPRSVIGRTGTRRTGAASWP